MFTKALDIDGPAGRLEAVMMTPKGEPTGAAVICHAHPLHGGVPGAAPRHDGLR